MICSLKLAIHIIEICVTMLLLHFLSLRGVVRCGVLVVIIKVGALWVGIDGL